MTPMITDPVLYMKFGKDGGIIGMNGSCVDDRIQTNDKNFFKLAKRTQIKFDISGDEEPTMTFARFEIS